MRQSFNLIQKFATHLISCRLACNAFVNGTETSANRFSMSTTNNLQDPENFRRNSNQMRAAIPNYGCQTWLNASLKNFVYVARQTSLHEGTLGLTTKEESAMRVNSNSCPALRPLPVLNSFQPSVREILLFFLSTLQVQATLYTGDLSCIHRSVTKVSSWTP